MDKLPGYAELTADTAAIVRRLLEGLDPKQRLEGLDPKQRLEGLDPTEEDELFALLQARRDGRIS